MADKIPEEFRRHFRYANYHLIQNFDMLSETDGKFGHLFGDNLMKRGDFDMQTYINVSADLLTGEGTRPNVTEVPASEYSNVFWGNKTRDFVTQFIYIVNVGSLCCGHRGVWHGGVTSAIFDNAFGVLGTTLLNMAATKYMNIQFRAPVMVGESVALVVAFDPADIQGSKRDRFVAHGEMYNQQGVLVATGESELVDVSARWASKST